ncbi:MAG: sugar ABC transporter substrate-binding protein [Rhodanobacter denitrificans]|uniref:Sugar ABC transporter substrate-binding protein n=1 Tax=Rhodanobacter denitrificans TaxID=666685 RepID=A0A2W5KAG7_9GAMM|nr:MAG: sugar ABC transporter substrate-binding protein [Rhodanobacter denitrificans]
MSRLGMAVVLLVAALPAIAQDALPEVQAVPPPVETYRIGVDDVVQVSVWRNPDLSVSVPVRPDGKISVPLIGDVDAGGRHPQDVAEDIKGKLSTYVRDPQVAVILTELRSHEYLARVRVTGAVRQPVSLPYRQGMSVLDAVLAAGGTNEFASADNTRLYRKEGDSVKTFPIKLDRILKKGDLSTNLPVQAGDVVTVPERAF